MNICKQLNILKRWQLCCLLFFVFGCNSQKEKIKFSNSKTDSTIENERVNLALHQIYKIRSSVHSADLILRTGKDYTSQLMRNLSLHDKTYSHSGIASWENDTLFVYHALGGEWNPKQKLRRDPFEIFCNPYENRGFGVYRYRINKLQEENIISLSKKLYAMGIIFDMKFDLLTDDKMYCSEFVYKTIKRATSDSINFNTTTLNHINFVAVDNLFINPFCEKIKRISFAKQ